MACEERGPCEFGFWLPHRLLCDSEAQIKEQLQGHVNVFKSDERIFRNYFWVLPEELELEDEWCGFRPTATVKSEGTCRDQSYLETEPPPSWFVEAVS